MMKRQRNMVKVSKSKDGENHVEVLKSCGVRKRKKKVNKVEEEIERRDESRESSMAVALALAWEEEEAWLCRSSGVVVDEQMSWGLLWFPCWDMEFMGDAYNQLYSDVVWEDDIWNLKSITQIPNP